MNDVDQLDIKQFQKNLRSAAEVIELSSKLAERVKTLKYELVLNNAKFETIMINVDNEKLSDADFRQFIRNTFQ